MRPSRLGHLAAMMAFTIDMVTLVMDDGLCDIWLQC